MDSIEVLYVLEPSVNIIEVVSIVVAELSHPAMEQGKEVQIGDRYVVGDCESPWLEELMQVLCYYIEYLDSVSLDCWVSAHNLIDFLLLRLGFAQKHILPDRQLDKLP